MTNFYFDQKHKRKRISPYSITDNLNSLGYEIVASAGTPFAGTPTVAKYFTAFRSAAVLV